MKKENKQLAQKKRAQMKKRQAIKEVVVKVLKISIPTILLLAAIIFALMDPFSSENKTENENDTTVNEATTNEATTNDANLNDANSAGKLNTDSSLKVEKGHTVNIDYVGKIDGVEFAGGNTEGMGADLVIGSGTYIDDFEEQLIGAHPGDTVEVNVTFPENYGNEQLNGKEAVFEVVVHGIYQ